MKYYRISKETGIPFMIVEAREIEDDPEHIEVLTTYMNQPKYQRMVRNTGTVSYVKTLDEADFVLTQYFNFKIRETEDKLRQLYARQSDARRRIDKLKSKM